MLPFDRETISVNGWDTSFHVVLVCTSDFTYPDQQEGPTKFIVLEGKHRVEAVKRLTMFQQLNNPTSWVS